MANVMRTEDGNHGRFKVEEDGQTMGELTYSRASDSLVILDHTAVSPDARGTGVGRMLVDAAVSWARESHTMLMPLCPYARSVFEKDASLSDVWHR
jgi:uncharacterized protein